MEQPASRRKACSVIEAKGNSAWVSGTSSRKPANFSGSAAPRKPKADDLKANVDKLALPVEGLDVKVDGDKVTVSGKAPSQEIKEKVILALGNVPGVAKVEDHIETPPGEQATFYTVQKGDTLSAISKKQYGDANKYNAIFEANKPMLTHPDKIYPGQVLRIPKLG